MTHTGGRAKQIKERGGKKRAVNQHAGDKQQRCEPYLHQGADVWLAVRQRRIVGTSAVGLIASVVLTC